MIVKIRQTCKTKNWWRNMDNITINYQHMGEDTYMRFLHMNDKCEYDRVALHPYLPKWGKGMVKKNWKKI